MVLIKLCNFCVYSIASDVDDIRLGLRKCAHVYVKTHLSFLVASTIHQHPSKTVNWSRMADAKITDR